MIVRVLAKASTVVQIIHTTSIERCVKLVEKSHDASVKWRQTFVCVFFGSGFVPEVECERVTIVTQCVTLEPVPLPLIRYPQLVNVMALEF